MEGDFTLYQVDRIDVGIEWGTRCAKTESLKEHGAVNLSGLHFFEGQNGYLNLRQFALFNCFAIYSVINILQ